MPPELAYSPSLSPPRAPSPPDSHHLFTFPSEGYPEVLWPLGNMLLQGQQVPLEEVHRPGVGKALSPEGGDSGCMILNPL